MSSLMRWIWAGQWRASPGRALTAVVAIAIGVALGLAIHLVNRSALEEFDAAIAVVNGEAQARLEATSGNGFDESAWPLLAREPLVQAGSPAIELDLAATVEGRPDAAPQRLKVVAIDPLRAAEVTPGLLPRVDQEAGEAGPAALFADDAIFLSESALKALDLRPGASLLLRSGLETSRWRVAGTVPGAAPGQAIAVTDLGSAQWRFGWLGRLSRIDLRLVSGATLSGLQEAVGARLPPGAGWSGPDASRQRMSNLSRAYRVNLNVLALVALFTGGFIVYSTVSLGVVRQQQELALLGVLGAPRSFLSTLVLGQARCWGAKRGPGPGGGINRGGHAGADRRRPRRRLLPRASAHLALDAAALALFAALGIGTGLAGSAVPARALRRLVPARALKGGGEAALDRRHAAGWSAALALAGAVLAALPPVAGLPLAAYAAIAAWLFAGIVFVPLLTRALGWLLAAMPGLAWRRPALWLAVQRIRGAPNSASAALAGVVASVALATAMAIMVHSFRGSVERWLDTVLPADLYGRAGVASAPGRLPEGVRERLESLPGVAAVELQRAVEIVLDPARPAAMLLSRPLAGEEARRLPLTGELLRAPPGAVAIHVSEAMVDLYGFAPGRLVTLPIGPASQRFFVASVWRDYARQHGAIAIDAADYLRLTGDDGVNEVSIRLQPAADAQRVLDALRERVPELAAVEFRSAAELRAVSLRIFDRSFAVTYALEAIAIVVGLFGVAATYAGEAIARAREFGMLRHLGLTRGGVTRTFALESTLLILAGLAWGAAVGTLIAMVLVHRVNPQSFHWTMDLAWPLPLLGVSAAALLAFGVIAAVLASRSATGAGPVRAVREDW
jgi:putative ABC transport system permease protein